MDGRSFNLDKTKKNKDREQAEKTEHFNLSPHPYPQGFRERETGGKIKTWLRERWRIDRMIETLI